MSDDYKKIQNAFQEERGGRRNLYDARSFMVRTRSEAIAAKRLREVVRLTLRRDFAVAEDILSELKISDPQYFEVFRIDAFVGYRMGDVARTRASYETALELDARQAQVFFWYGGFLMRSIGDYEGAAVQYNRALELDPNSSALLREAARNALFGFDFVNAQEFIDRSWALERKTFRDDVILSDLQAQVHIRKAENLWKTGDPFGAARSMDELRTFVASLEARMIDQTLADHVLKAKRIYEGLRLSEPTANEPMVAKFGEWIAEFERSAQFSMQDGIRTGRLREEGRQANFGFLREADGTDTFVHKSDVDEALWLRMVAGELVVFQILVDERGRKRATHVSAKEIVFPT